ncbi:MAG: ABC transporter substrate-binding protein, partial [Alphaproteobacteria bacterium]
MAGCRRRFAGILRPLAGLMLGVLAAMPDAMGQSAASAPQRVVSLNVCSDQLLLQLAPRDAIASLSFLVADPAVSAMADAAAGVSLNHGLAEEILPLQPDLVFAGAYGARPAVALLENNGVRVERMGLALSLDDVMSHIEQVAAALRRPAAGQALARQVQERIAAAGRGAAPRQDRPRAITYHANGLTAGSGTLTHDIIEAAGFVNLAAELGVDGLRPLSIEALVDAAPDLIILGAAREGPPSLATALLRHPALVGLLQRARTLVIAESALACGPPGVTAALDQLGAVRRQMTAR